MKSRQPTSGGSTQERVLVIPEHALVRLKGKYEPIRIERWAEFFACPQCGFQAREVIEIQVWEVSSILENML